MALKYPLRTVVADNAILGTESYPNLLIENELTIILLPL